MKKLLALLTVCGMLFSSTAFAHGGGLDANGCHHNWANGTGQYHCHR